MAFVKNKLSSLILIAVSVIVLLVGIGMEAYHFESWFNFELFEGSFALGLAGIFTNLLIIAAAGGVIVAALELLNVIKGELVGKIMTYVIAGLAIAVPVLYIIYMEIWFIWTLVLVGGIALALVALKKIYVK